MIRDIESAFDDGAAFIPYIAAGDTGPIENRSVETPDERAVNAIEATNRYVRSLVQGGADIVELGLPFSEPIADGPTIQRASIRALDNGMTPSLFFEIVQELDVDVPLVVMTYYNLVYRYGTDPGVNAFVERAAAVGIDGIIVPDLPVEEGDALRSACKEQDVALIYIIAPTTSDDRIARIMSLVSGYVYVQARLGTTGARGSVSDQTKRSLDRIWMDEQGADRDPIPKAVGFGVSTGDHAADIIAAGADGVIVGSALVDIIAEGDNESGPIEDRLERKARELKDGAIAGLTRRAPRPERT